MDMNIQLLIVILIGIGVAVIVARKIYRFFTVKEQSSHCSGCSACETQNKKAH